MFSRKSDKNGDTSSDGRRRKGDSSSSRTKRTESIVSSSSSRDPARDDDRSKRTIVRTYTYPSVDTQSEASSYATAPTERQRTGESSRFDKPKRRATDDADSRYYYENDDSSERRDRGMSDASREPSRRSDRSERKEGTRTSGRSERDRGVNGSDEYISSRAGETEAFNAQVASPGFTQFPGQTSGGAPYVPPFQPTPSAESAPSRPPMPGHSHTDPVVGSQYPGENSSNHATPFRPPPSGPGLAAEYYGDQGESVYSQPGVRPEPKPHRQDTDSHLMTPTVEAMPAQDTGHGSAADYYNSTSPKPQAQTGTPQQGTGRPPMSKPSGSSGSGMAMGATALAGGAALGYALSHESQGPAGPATSSASYQQSMSASISGPRPPSSQMPGAFASPSPAIPPSQSIPSTPQMPHSGKPSGSNLGAYAAGAAGLAAGAYALHEMQSHQQHSHSTSANGQHGAPAAIPYGRPPSITGMRRRQRGPLNKFVDWWKDYEDVAKMEEYTEYIGVCAECFDPRSSPIDAPRKHHYHHRRSSEKLRERRSRESLRRSGGRVEKRERYYASSDEEKKGGYAKWVAAGLAGAGLAKAARVFGRKDQDFDDTYSIKTGRFRESRESLIDSKGRASSRTSRGVVHSRHSEVGGNNVVSESSEVRIEKDSRGSYKFVRTHKSRSRSRSRDRTSAVLGATAGAAVAASAIAAHERHKQRSRSRSPRKHRHSSSRASGYVESSHGDRRYSRHSEASSSRIGLGSAVGAAAVAGTFAEAERERRSRKTSKGGFFGFGNPSTSSIDASLAYGVDARRRKHRSSAEHTTKHRSSNEKLNATLIGIGATAATLAAAQHGSKVKHAPHAEVIAVRHRKSSHHSQSPRRHRHSGAYASSSSIDSDDDAWQDVPDSEEEYAGLAYGNFDYKGKGRKSTDSLVSNDSGVLSKWGWRWGKKKDKASREDLTMSGGLGPSVPSVAGTTAAIASAAAAGAMLGKHEGALRHEDSTQSLQSIQSVYPIPTNDPYSFDAIRHAEPTSQQPPIYASRPENIPLQQPQPIAPINGAVYTAQPPTSNFIAPTGPPVFYTEPEPIIKKVTRHESIDVTRRDSDRERDPRRRRRASSPTPNHLGRDAAIAGIAAAATAGVIAVEKSREKETRFELDREQRERERRRKDEEDAKWRAKEAEEAARQERERESRHRERWEAREAERRADKLERERVAAEVRAKEEAERVERERREQIARDRERRDRERREAREAREAERRRLREEREKTTAGSVAEGLAGAAITGAAVAAIAESRKGKDLDKFADRKPRIEERTEERRDSTPKDRDDARAHEMSGDRPSIVAVVPPPEELGKPSMRTVVPAVIEVKPPEPSKVQVDTFDEDFDPNYFKKRREQREQEFARQAAAKIVAEYSDPDQVFREFEERYSKENEYPSQVEVFTPAGLHDSATTTERKVDNPNADVDIHVQHADRLSGPPYEPAYAFTATKEPLSTYQALWPIPILNLIEPTPVPTPAPSVAGSVCGTSPPASPEVKPVDDAKVAGKTTAAAVAVAAAAAATAAVSSKSTTEERAEPEPEPEPEPQPKPEQPLQSTVSGSRVSWGENQTHHYEVPTPEPSIQSLRDSYISGQQEKRQELRRQASDEIIIEEEEPSGIKRKSYRPSSRSPPPESQRPREAVRDEVETPVDEEVERFFPDSATVAEPPEEVEEEHIYESHSPEREAIVIEPNDRVGRDGFYESPFFETVSDLGLEANDGRRHGFVEGEVFDDTPAAGPSVEKDLPHGMPGGFIEEEETEDGVVSSEEVRRMNEEEAERLRHAATRDDSVDRREFAPASSDTSRISGETLSRSDTKSKRKSRSGESERDPRDIDPTIEAVTAGVAAAGLGAAAAQYMTSRDEEHRLKDIEIEPASVDVFDYIDHDAEPSTKPRVTREAEKRVSEELQAVERRDQDTSFEEARVSMPKSSMSDLRESPDTDEAGYMPLPRSYAEPFDETVAEQEATADDFEEPGRRKEKHSRKYDNDHYRAVSPVSEASSRSKVSRSRSEDDYDERHRSKHRSKDHYDDDDHRHRIKRRSTTDPDDTSASSKSSKSRKSGILGSIFGGSKSGGRSDSVQQRSSKDDYDEKERHRKKSHSSRDTYYDDDVSRVSSRSDERRERHKNREERDRYDGFDDREERHKNREERDRYDGFNDRERERSRTDERYVSRYSEQPPDDVVEEVLKSPPDSSNLIRNERDGDKPFLGMRAEAAVPLPASTAIHSTSLPSYVPTSAEPTTEDRRSVQFDLPPLPESRPSSPIEVGSATDLPPLPDSPPTLPLTEGIARDLPPLPASRPLSLTSVDSLSDLPAIAPDTPESRHEQTTPTRLSLESQRAASTTAIPLRFRRPPPSPSHARRISSPGVAQPGQDVSTPPSTSAPYTDHPPMSPLGLSWTSTRHAKAPSSDHRPSVQFSGSEFRPLYLMEQARSRSMPRLEDEVLPPLPPSGESSRAPSVEGEHDPEEEESHDEVFESAAQSPDASFHSPEADFHDIRDISVEDMPPIAGEYKRHEEDYLDSQQATPTAATFPVDVFSSRPASEEFATPQPKEAGSILPALAATAVGVAGAATLVSKPTPEDMSTVHASAASPVPSKSHRHPGWMGEEFSTELSYPSVAARFENLDRLTELPDSRPSSPSPAYKEPVYQPVTREEEPVSATYDERPALPTYEAHRLPTSVLPAASISEPHLLPEKESGQMLPHMRPTTPIEAVAPGHPSGDRREMEAVMQTTPMEIPEPRIEEQEREPSHVEEMWGAAAIGSAAALAGVNLLSSSRDKEDEAQVESKAQQDEPLPTLERTATSGSAASFHQAPYHETISDLSMHRPEPDSETIAETATQGIAQAAVESHETIEKYPDEPYPAGIERSAMSENAASFYQSPNDQTVTDPRVALPKNDRDDVEESAPIRVPQHEAPSGATEEESTTTDEHPVKEPVMESVEIPPIREVLDEPLAEEEWSKPEPDEVVEEELPKRSSIANVLLQRKPSKKGKKGKKQSKSGKSTPSRSESVSGTVTPLEDLTPTEKEDASEQPRETDVERPEMVNAPSEVVPPIEMEFHESYPEKRATGLPTSDASEQARAVEPKAEQNQENEKEEYPSDRPADVPETCDEPTVPPRDVEEQNREPKTDPLVEAEELPITVMPKQSKKDKRKEKKKQKSASATPDENLSSSKSIGATAALAAMAVAGIGAAALSGQDEEPSTISNKGKSKGKGKKKRQAIDIWADDQQQDGEERGGQAQEEPVHAINVSGEVAPPSDEREILEPIVEPKEPASEDQPQKVFDAPQEFQEALVQHPKDVLQQDDMVKERNLADVVPEQELSECHAQMERVETLDRELEMERELADDDLPHKVASRTSTGPLALPPTEPLEHQDEQFKAHQPEDHKLAHPRMSSQVSPRTITLQENEGLICETDFTKPEAPTTLPVDAEHVISPSESTLHHVQNNLVPQFTPLPDDEDLEPEEYPEPQEVIHGHLHPSSTKPDESSLHMFEEQGPEHIPLETANREFEEHHDQSTVIEKHLHLDEETPALVPPSHSFDEPAPESIALPESEDLGLEEYQDASTTIEKHLHDEEAPALVLPSHSYDEPSPESIVLPKTRDLEVEEYHDPSTAIEKHLHHGETPALVPPPYSFDEPALESIALPESEDFELEEHLHHEATPALVPPSHSFDEPVPESVTLPEIRDLKAEEYQDLSATIEKHLHHEETPVLVPPSRSVDEPVPESIALPETRDLEVEEYHDLSTTVDKHLHREETPTLVPPSHEPTPESFALPETQDLEVKEHHDPSTTVDKHLHHEETPTLVPPSHEPAPESFALPETRDLEVEEYHDPSTTIEKHLHHEGPPALAPPSHSFDEPAPESIALPESEDLDLEEYHDSSIAIEKHIHHEETPALVPPSHSDEPAPESIASPETQDPEVEEYHGPSTTVETHLHHKETVPLSHEPAPESIALPETQDLEVGEYRDPSTTVEKHLLHEETPASVPPSHEPSPKSIALPETQDLEAEEYHDPSATVEKTLHRDEETAIFVPPSHSPDEPAPESIALPETQDLEVEEYQDPSTTISDHLHPNQPVEKEAAAIADQQAEEAVESRDFAKVLPEDLEALPSEPILEEPPVQAHPPGQELAKTLQLQAVKVAAEDELTDTPSKKGKKSGKKGKKSGKQTPSRMPVGVAMPQSKEAYISETVSAEDTGATTTPAPEEDANELNVEETPAKRSKKGRKGKRGSVASMPLVTAESSTPVAIQEDLKEMDLDDIPVQRAEDILMEASLPAAEMDPGDESAGRSKKKGKRSSKQSKRISLSSTPPVIEEAREVVTEEEATKNMPDALNELEDHAMKDKADGGVDEQELLSSTEPQVTYPERPLEANKDTQSAPIFDNVEEKEKFATPSAVLAVTETAEMLRKEKESENEPIAESRKVPEYSDKRTVDEGILEMETHSIETTEPATTSEQGVTAEREPEEEPVPGALLTRKLSKKGSEKSAENAVPQAPSVDSLREVPTFESASIPLPTDDGEELGQAQVDGDGDQEEQVIESYVGPAAVEESGAPSDSRTTPADAKDLGHQQRESPIAAGIETTPHDAEERHQPSFDPASVLADPVFSRPSSRAGALDEPSYDELPLHGSKRPSRPSSRRASCRASVDVLARRQPATRDAEPNARPPPTDDKEFADLLAAGLQGAGFDPSIVREDKSYAERLPPQQRLSDDEPEEFSELHRRPKKGKRSRTASPPEEHVTVEPGAVSEPSGSAEQFFEIPMTAEPEELDVTKDVKDQPEKPTAAVLEKMERSAPVEATAEDEWAVPVRKASKKGKKGKKGSKSSSNVPSGTASPSERLQQEIMVPEPPAQSSETRQIEKQSPEDRVQESSGHGLEDAILEAAAVGAAAASIGIGKHRQDENVATAREEPSMADPSQKDTKPHLRRKSIEIISPTSTDGRPRRISELFPELERVKRKAPVRQDSITDQPTKRVSLGSGEAAVERLRSPRPSISHLATEEPNIVKQVSAQDLAKPSWSWPEPENRDSAVVMESPVPPSTHEKGIVRDSGYHDLPITPNTAEEQPSQRKQRTSSHGSQKSPTEMQIEVSPQRNVSGSPILGAPARESIDSVDSLPRATPRSWEHPMPDRAPPSPPAVESMSKDRSSMALFESSPSIREPPSFGIESSESVHPTVPAPTAMASDRDVENSTDSPTSIFGRQDKPQEGLAPYTPTPVSHGQSPSVPLDTIPETSPESPLAKKWHPLSDLEEPDHGMKAARRSETPESIARKRRQASLQIVPPETSEREFSPASMVSMGELIDNRAWPEIDEDRETVGGIEQVLQEDQSKRTPSSGHAANLGRESRKVSPFSDHRSPSVLSDKSMSRVKSPDHIRSASVVSNRSDRSLRRVDMSGDLRSASRLSGAGVRISATPQSQTPTLASASANERLKGIGRRISMEGVYEGVGDASPMSPTGRPPSVRKRQSLLIMDMEARLDQLTAENRSLQDSKAKAEAANQDYVNDRELYAATVRQAREAVASVASRDALIKEKDAEIAEIKEMVDRLREEVDKLAGENARLTAQNQSIATDAQRFADLQSQSAEAHQKWQESARSLEELRTKHEVLSRGMEQIVQDEVDARLRERDDEIRQLRQKLDTTHQQLQNLQREMIDSGQADDFLNAKSDDYIETACQQLCQHVQQWVLRFSKFSDNRACRLSSEIRDDKLEEMLDDAMLDGSDVDKLLNDRVRRRDVFMSVVMSIIWKYVFSRYLFGLDREQRQKLKSLEATLKEVGPQRAVAQWRAITLTLLSRREVFIGQRAQDTEAVVHEVYSVLTKLLPPPSHLQNQIIESLRNVMRLAVELAIDMRCQRPEYIMLPPLRPEYDVQTGELVEKVQFNSALMNERSGEFTSNEEVEEKGAEVKIVLFPLVVKKGDDFGEGEEETIICPAQVIVVKPNDSKKVVRVMSGAMDIDTRQSLTSVMPSGSAMG